jgi:biopolymer transport protein ExbD
MSDKDVPYAVLRKVMVTCASANFGDVSFALRRKEGKDA